MHLSAEARSLPQSGKSSRREKTRELLYPGRGPARNTLPSAYEAGMPDQRYEYAVFINCPFDEAYRPLFEAVVFAVHDCGYVARSSLEVTAASQVRIEKIPAIIEACKLGIHDISRTEIDPQTQLLRFNMPLELGLCLGAERFGAGKHKTKTLSHL